MGLCNPFPGAFLSKIRKLPRGRSLGSDQSLLPKNVGGVHKPSWGIQPVVCVLESQLQKELFRKPICWMAGAFMDLTHLPMSYRTSALRVSNLCLVHCRSLEVLAVGALLWPGLLAEGMDLRWSLFRDVRRGRVSCSCRRSYRQIYCATGSHLSHVGVLVVPTGSRIDPNSAMFTPR